MEIELSRLTEELTSRDRNWRSVPAAWRTSFAKPFSGAEPYPYAQPGVAERIVWSGNSVRLNVNVRETHAMLLDVLLNSMSSIRICLTATV